MSNSEIEALIARIEELEDKVDFLLSHETVAYVPVSRSEKAANEAAVVDLLKRGNMKEALRLYREKHVMPFSQVQQEIEELKKKGVIVVNLPEEDLAKIRSVASKALFEYFGEVFGKGERDILVKKIEKTIGRPLYGR